MYPTLVVLAGYLAAEIFLEGLAAAGAVLALAAVQFLLMLLTGKGGQPAILLEGAVLAGVLLAGWRLSGLGYSGAGLAILEVLLGGVLTVSALAGRPWLSKQMKRVAGFSTEKRFAVEVSLVMGAVFLLHGGLMAAMVLSTGGVPVLPAAAAFAVLYAGALILMRRKQRARAEMNAPRLMPREDGKTALELSGRELASIRLEAGPVSLVKETELREGVEVHEFLEALERLLRSRGCRALRFTEWEGDTLPLELAGYRGSPAGWTRPL